MADLLTRLSGPQTPSRSDAGTTIYTPQAREIVAVKNAIVSNPDPLKGGWIYLAINNFTSRSNIIIPGVFIPPNTVLSIPLDFVMNGGTETLLARQVVDMSYSKMVPAKPTGFVNVASTTDGTTFATASWTAKNPMAYVMFIVSTHATAAAAPTSFTDTHTGVTWTQVGSTLTNILGVGAGNATMAISVWRCQSSGTTNTTTTANFGATMTGCHIELWEVPFADTTGTNGSEAFTDGGTFLFTTVTGTAIVHPGSVVCGARAYALTSNAGSTSTPGAGFTELSDAAIATPTNMMTTEYSISPGAVADLTLATTSTDKMGALVNMQDGSTPLNIIVDGVVIK